MNTIVTAILVKTGYRFPKHEGWFCRESTSRKWLRRFGVQVVLCNIRADMKTDN